MESHDAEYREGISGWNGKQQPLSLDQFEAVICTSDGSYGVADEYRCRACGAIGAQGIEPKTLADLTAMAQRHECLPRV